MRTNICGFLLTPLREGRRRRSSTTSISALFLLTPLREGRRGTIKRAASDLWISTHAPAGGATILQDHPASISPDFYSRPCGRGDNTTVYVDHVDDLISTHAPAGGATGRVVDLNGAELFLLTPLREGRLVSEIEGFLFAAISTHAPAGGATIYARYSSAGQNISTHAPAGGATDPYSGTVRVDSISTHAPAGGATRVSRKLDAMHDEFLLTPLREGRLEPAEKAADLRSDFYSRPCGRGDRTCRRPQRCRAISTHAPAGGATCMQNEIATLSGIFLLTPLREGRLQFSTSPS